MSLRVLHVITDTQRRGAQVFGHDLASRLDEMAGGHRLVALTDHPQGAIDAPTLGARARGPGTLWALGSAMRDADVTVAHGSSTLAACGVAGLASHRPFVYRQISDPVFWTESAGRRWRTRQLYRLPRHVVSLSGRTATVLAERFGLDQRRITVIPNAADERRFEVTTSAQRAEARSALGLDDDAPVIAYIGALAREKGVHDLVDAVDAGTVLLMAGTGPEAAAVAQHAADRGIALRLLGAVSDPRPVYAAADVFVLPSWSEQQPGVLLEAALSGLACVSTDVGVVDDIVVDGETGLLVPPRDPTALGTALRGLLESPAERTRLSTAARARVVEGFSLTVIAERWMRLLESLGP